MTAVALTPLPDLGAVRIEITGAPSPGAPAYEYIVGSAPDYDWVGDGALPPSWESPISSTPGVIHRMYSYGEGGTSPYAPSDSTTRMARSVTGLTIGLQYRLRVEAKGLYTTASNFDTPSVAVGVDGIGATARKTLSGAFSIFEYVFTATATSHTIQVFHTRARFPTRNLSTDIKSVVLEEVPENYAPLTAIRVDANGAGPVRLLENQEPIAGDLTVTDYEPALNGVVRYDVTDGLGRSISVSTSLDGSGQKVEGYLRENIQVNPSLETGNLAGWGISSGATEAVSTAQKYAGTYSLAVTADANASSYGYMLAVSNTPDHPATAGYVYSGFARFRAETTARSVRVGLTFFEKTGDSTYSLLGATVYGSYVTDTTTGWTSAQVNGVTAPANTTHIQLAAYISGSIPSGEVHYIDTAMIERATTAGTYIEGTVDEQLTVVHGGTYAAAAGPWLHIPVTPSLSTVADLYGYSDNRQSGSTLHEVIGRSDPLVTIGVPSMRRGQLRYRTASRAEAELLGSIYGSRETAMLRTSDGEVSDFYHVAESVSLSPGDQLAAGRTWYVDVSYLETARPTAPLKGAAGWTFASVLVNHTDFASVRASYDTFADLTAGA